AGAQIGGDCEQRLILIRYLRTILSGEGIGNSDTAEWVIEAYVVIGVGRRERCNVGEWIVNAGLRWCVEHSGASADGGLAILGQAESQADTRPHVAPTRIGARLGAVRIVVRAAVQNAVWSGRITL